MKQLIRRLLKENIDDFFDSQVPAKKSHGEVIKKEHNVKFIVIPLYRGIRNKVELIEDGNGYILDNTTYPDNAIWFSQNKDFAEGYNLEALLTYHLKMAKHSIKKTYSDGHTEENSIFDENVIAVFNHKDINIKVGDTIGNNVLEDWPFYG